MFSRWIFLLALLFASACTPKVGETPPRATMGELGTTACLSETSEVMKSFFAGSAAPGEVDGGWDCIQNAFRTFNKYFIGKRDPQKIYPEELAAFFEKYFIARDPVTGMPKNIISKDLQNEFMKVKQLLLGGTREYITREEFANIANIITKLHGLSVRMNRYMGVYTLNWHASGDDYTDTEFFESANDSLQDFSKEISELMVRDHQPYSFDDFFGLLDQLGKFYHENWEIVGTMKEYMPLVSKIKKVVAGGPEDRIQYGEWKNFLMLGARAYIQYTRYVYFLKESATGTSIRLSQIASAATDLMSAFEDLLRDKPGMITRRPGNRNEEREGKITRQELDELLGALHKVWPQFVYSEGLIDEVMVIKQVIFGGSEKHWTARDFEVAKLKVPYIREMLEKIHPYFSIYINEWNPNRYSNEKAQIYFKQAQINLADSMSQLGSLLESSYSLKRISRLLKEIEKLYPGTVRGVRLDTTYDKFFPLIQQVKNMLFEDQDDIIHREVIGGHEVNQWPNFLSMAGEMYSFYLHYNYFVADGTFDDYRVLFSLRYLLDSSFGTLGKFLNIKPSHFVSAKEATDVVVKLQKLDVLPKNMSKLTVERTMFAVLNSLLNPYKRRLAGQKPSLIDKPVLENVKYETSTWLETEIFIRDVFGRAADNVKIAPFELQKRIDEKLVEIQTPGPMQTGLLELKKVLSSSIPMIVDPIGRLQISANVSFMYTGDSVSRLNLTRAASRLLIRAYAGAESRIEPLTSVTKDEANFAYHELKWPFIDMGILKPGDNDFINSRFLEANIFVPRADGNNEASFLELSDIINTIFSGVKLDTQLKPGLLNGTGSAAGCLPGINDPPSSASIKYDCLFANYLQQIPQLFTSMPDYLRFFSNNDPCQTEILFFNLLKAAGYVPNEKKEVMLADSGLFPHIVQYLELVMVRFDTDKSNTFNLEEAERAWPIFHDLFKDLAKSYLDSGILKDADLVHVFTWVLHNGHIPGFTDFIDLIIWKNSLSKRKKLNTDRNKLGLILGVVADQVSASKQGRISDEEKAKRAEKAIEIFKQHLSPFCAAKVKVESRPNN